jgi:hypothetical protein
VIRAYPYSHTDSNPEKTCKFYKKLLLRSTITQNTDCLQNPATGPPTHKLLGHTRGSFIGVIRLLFYAFAVFYAYFGEELK